MGNEKRNVLFVKEGIESNRRIYENALDMTTVVPIIISIISSLAGAYPKASASRWIAVKIE